MSRQEFPAAPRTGAFESEAPQAFETADPPPLPRLSPPLPFETTERERSDPPLPLLCKHGNASPPPCDACTLVELMQVFGLRADAHVADLARAYVAQGERTRRELVRARHMLHAVCELAEACAAGVPADVLLLLLRCDEPEPADDPEHDPEPPP